GGLHGAYLAVNHGFRATMARTAGGIQGSRLYGIACWSLTFLAVVVAWVFFRAPTFTSAGRLLEGMTGVSRPAAIPHVYPALWNAGLDPSTGFLICALLATVAMFAPNSNAVGRQLHTLAHGAPGRRAFIFGFAATLVVLLIALNESRDSVSAFIYFNF
ncbi:MAG: MBOAT family protein, partial [Steroidobacteraceae bacterium]